MTVTAEQLFSHLHTYKVIICKSCKYAVWPSEVDSHLSGAHHRIAKQQRRTIVQEISLWQDLVVSAEELRLPAQLKDPIPELALHDGFLCKINAENCQAVFTSQTTLKKHWVDDHDGWTITNRSTAGRPSIRAKANTQKRTEEAQCKVRCQRFFGSRHGSHYIRVVEPLGAQNNQEPIDTWKEMEEKAHQACEEMERESRDRVEEGDKDDVNPWLSRARWHKYLEGCSPEELMASVASPSDDPEKPEPYEKVIWQTMTEVVRLSQATVSKAGVFVRMEAIRTEKHQTRYTPLETYWDPDSIERRAQPWRQILMFLVRTQKAHEWDSPAYKFTREQATKFHRLIEEASRVVDGEVDEDVDGEPQQRGETEELGETEEAGEPEELGEPEEAGNGDMTDIQRACLDFCIELLNMEIQFDEYESVAVCAMAVLGVTEIGWRGPESYPPIISEFIKCARFMVIQKAAHMAGLPDKDEPFAGRRKMDLDDDSGYESNGNASPSPLSRPAFRRQEIPSSPFGSEPASPTRFRWAATSLHGGSRPEDASSPIVGARIQSQVRHDKKSCLHYVNTMMDEFMVRGSRSPMQWMLDLRTYGMKIHYNTTTSGHVEWCNGDELLYKNVQFNMAQFRGMVHGLMAQTKEIMVEELLFGGGGREGEIPDVPWNTIRDDPTNTTPGWSFLDDERTRLPVDGKSWLFERIGQHSDIRQRFERPGTATGLNGVEVEKYMASVARFREKLLCCMHILGGQPGRATEVLSIRHSNTWKGGHRNIFIEDGLVAFVTRYHKGFALSGDVKLIHRYLPREIGTLLVWYLWLVRPFERRLQAIVGDQYMKGLKEDQKSESKVARLFCRDGNGRQWTPDRMRQALERVTSKGLGHGLHILAYRHIAIGISRRYMRGGTAFSKDEDGKGGNDGEDEIEDLQAAHGSYMAGLVYARGMFEMHGAVASRRQQFRESSIDWHRFFAMQSAMEMTVGQKRKRDWFDEEAKEGQYERWARLKEMNMRVQFARMMNLEEKEGEFRGVQKQAIEAIQARVSQVVAVMPTGTGKSILFMLPAWVQRGGTTVVIVPLTVLRHDMQQRCARLGISCAEWEGSLTPPDGASIVLMTPEAALDDGEGSSFINRLKVTRRLDRIVIDECHVILNMDAKFRPRLRELGDLARAETQMVLLTATLPPSKEGLLWERMSWSAEQVTMFRMDTTRKNIRYSVVDPGRRIKRDEHDGFIADMVSKTSGKGVVYCKAKRRVKDIVEAKLFDCDAFHGDMTKKQRAQVLEAFRTGKTQVVVATNALGMGVDLPDIDWVIHADEPRDLLDYAQESGRGGRDGRPTQAILVTRYDQKVNSMVQSYIDGEGGCRRKIPAAYLDGNNERGQCKMDEEACDLCRPDEDSAELIEDIEEQIVGGHEEQIVGGHEEQIVGGHEEQIVGGHEEQEVGGHEEVVGGHEEQELDGHEEQAFRDRGRQRESEERREATRQIEEQFITQERQATAVRMRRDRERMIEAGVAERLEKQLWAWKGKCIVCRAAGTWCDHVITNTRFHDRSDARNEVLQRRNRVRFLDFSACVKCAAPQSMCNRYRDNGKGGWEKYQEDCQWYGIMGSTVFALRHAYEDIWEAWKQRLAAMEVDVGSDRAVEEYLGKRKDIGGLQGSNMAFEFLWITEQIEATDR